MNWNNYSSDIPEDEQEHLRERNEQEELEEEAENQDA